jgi:hypothetical protein
MSAIVQDPLCSTRDASIVVCSRTSQSSVRSQNDSSLTIDRMRRKFANGAFPGCLSADVSSLVPVSDSRRRCRGSLFSTTDQRDNQVEVHLVITAVAKALGFPLPQFIFICSSRRSGSPLEDDALIEVVKTAAFGRTVAALDFVTRSPQRNLA